MSGVGTTHHVNIGGHYYLVKPGSYQKRVAPQFGARFSTGDPDFNNMSVWQHWAQMCWVGGADAELWVDDAMYDDAIGIDSTVHEQLQMGRGLNRGIGSNWGISAPGVNSQAGFKVIIYAGWMFVATIPALGSIGHLWRYDPSTDGWTRITTLDAANITIRSIATFDGKVFIGGVANGTSTPKVVYCPTSAMASWTVLANPAGVPAGAIYSMHAFQQKLYVAYGTSIWRLKDDETWDGNTVFYKAQLGSDSNYMIGMEVHLGFLYMLSQNGHVHRSDGNTTFDMWSWDGQTTGCALKSFDGRLFILTFEYTSTTAIGYGVLYQMTGSAMTQLKRWGVETAATLIGNMVVYDRKLWYGASNLLGFGKSRSGFGVAVYDPIEDAHSIYASNSAAATYDPGVFPQTNYIVDDQIFFGGNLFVFVRGHGAFKTPYKYRDTFTGHVSARYDVTSIGASLVSEAGGWITSSTYDAGTPGVRKLWRKIAVDYTLPASGVGGIVVDYSVNNGATYTTAGTITTVGTRLRKEFFLNNVISTSVKLRLTLRSTDQNATPVIYGFVVSYLPVVEPNWLWTMTLVLSEEQTLLDGTKQTMDTEAELAFLRDAYRTKQLVTYTDADSSLWASGGEPGVLIYDIAFLLRDLTQPLEGEVQLTLLEAVETY